MPATENGKIIIENTKKGFCVEISFESGKIMPVPSFFNIPKDAGGKNAVVEKENGAIVNVVIDGKPCEKKNKPVEQKRPHENENRNNTIPEAVAPYNFIPLNNKVVYIEGNVPHFDKFHKELKTGYINIDIEAVTPVYIRGTGKDNTDFFSPANRHRIPGSSIRGLIRNIVEIASYGRFNFFDGDKKFNFRSFMDKSKKLKNAYVNYMIKSNNGIIEHPNLKAGYLIKKGHNKYAVKPSFSNENNCWFYRVEQDDANKIIRPTNSEQFFENIFFKPVKPVPHKHHDVTIKYAKITEISASDDSGLTPGYLIHSGSVSGRHRDGTPAGKHLDWIIAKPENNAQEIPVDKNVIENYKNDINRSEVSINLLKKLDDTGEAPCFYVTDNNNSEKIISIGHTGMFRLAYKHELKDFVKQQYEDDATDIPTAIFGSETKFASRVFFEDAYLDDSSKDKIQSNSVTPKILSGPKPTSFQLYLRQDTNNIRSDERGNLDGLMDYNNAGAEIRGYKMYWHKNIASEEYVEKDMDAIGKHDSQYTQIKPINSGAKFRGLIRFENLSEIELGALLFALKLKEDLCHKIGMGKPLGLGSIKITPKLTVFDIEKRYGELFDGWENEPSKDSAPMEYYIGAFDEYIRKNIGEASKKSLWEVERIKDLERMLDFKNKPSNSQTEYMAIKADKNDKNKKVFRKRGVLPVPKIVRTGK